MATVAEQYIAQKHREQEMIDKVHLLVVKQLSTLQQAANSANTYVEFTQHPAYMEVWQTQATIRDSLANTFSEDPVLRNQCIEVWSISFGERFMQIDAHVKQAKPLQ